MNIGNIYIYLCCFINLFANTKKCHYEKANFNFIGSFV